MRDFIVSPLYISNELQGLCVDDDGDEDDIRFVPRIFGIHCSISRERGSSRSEKMAVLVVL